MTSQNSPIWRRALACALAIALAVAGTPTRADAQLTVDAQSAHTSADEVAPVATEAPDEAQPSVASDDAVEKSVPSDSSDASDQQADALDDEASSKDDDAPAASAPVETAAPAQDASAGATPVSTQDETVSVKMAIIGRDANGRPESWSAATDCSVPTTSNAGDLTMSVLNASNLTYDASVTEYGLYLQTITSPDGARTLGYDETTGRYWQLFVNGTASSVGASDVHPAAGDTYVWYYSAFGDELPPATSSVTMAVIGRDADGRPESWVGEASHDVATFSSVASLTESVIASAGLASDSGYGTWGYYLNTITSPYDPDRTLGWDQSTGRYWQLFVNGVASDLGASSVQLLDGDSVVWYYSAYGDSLPTSTASVTVIGRDALGNVETWLPETSRTVEFPTTADKLTVDILRDARITADYGYGDWGFYLNSITSPFDPTWSPGWEEATGRYWQLFVNGKSSDLGASSVQLGDGDSIVWYYAAYGDSIPTSDVPINPGAAHPEVSHDWAGFKGNDGTGVVERSTPSSVAPAPRGRALRQHE